MPGWGQVRAQFRASVGFSWSRAAYLVGLKLGLRLGLMLGLMLGLGLGFVGAEQHTLRHGQHGCGEDEVIAQLDCLW